MAKKRTGSALVATDRPRKLQKLKSNWTVLQDSARVLDLKETIALLVPATAVLKGRIAIVEVMNTGRGVGAPEIFELAALLVDQGAVVGEYSTLVRTTRELPAETFQKSGIHDGMLTESGISLQDAMTELLAFVGDEFLIAYDDFVTQELLAHAANQYRIPFKNHFGATVGLARIAWPRASSYTIPALTRHLKLPPASTMAAMDKAVTNLRILHLAAKTLTGPDGRLSKSLTHWGQSPDTIKLRPSPW